MKDRLTAQQDQFVRLVVEEGHTLVGAYRLSYPPRNGPRSAEAERVAAKRVAHRPLVEQRIEQLREELLASDPVEMRSRANFVLGEILAKRLDPRYRRTALDVLKRLDEQERAAMKADREAYRTVVAQMAAIDAIENGATKRVRSTSAKPPAKEQPPVDLDQLINEIAQIAEERRHSRELEPPLTCWIRARIRRHRRGGDSVVEGCAPAARRDQPGTRSYRSRERNRSRRFWWK